MDMFRNRKGKNKRMGRVIRNGRNGCVVVPATLQPHRLGGCQFLKWLAGQFHSIPRDKAIGVVKMKRDASSTRQSVQAKSEAEV